MAAKSLIAHLPTGCIPFHSLFQSAILQYEILLSEVENAINKLKNNKSPGIDEIPAELIRAGGPQTAKEIHVICNKIWKEGRWPTDWSRSDW